jgi:two-component system sensor histidine kinase YesM
MVFIATFVYLAADIITYAYFSNILKNKAESATKATLNIETQYFKENFESIFSDTSAFISSTSMMKTLSDVACKNDENYITDYLNMQNDLQSLIHSNELIDSVFIVGNHGEFYSTTDIGLKNQNLFSQWKNSKISGVNWLSIRKDPFDSIKEIIPIVFPVTYAPFSITNPDKATATVYVLLNAGKINNTISRMNKNVSSMIYFADQNGNPLTVKQSNALYNIAFLKDVSQPVGRSDKSLNFNKLDEKDTYFISLNNLGLCNLKLVNIISKNQLLNGIEDVKNFLLIALIITLLICFILSYFLSKTITSPLRKLVSSIRSEKNEIPIVTNYHDEIGILNQTLNTMSTVIQQQIETIKHDEQEKAQAEINILTQQINPHFLYNTLECIHWEILAKNLESSADMVESLGDFLRLGLNHGDNTITLEMESKRTEQYINIMNHRFGQKILFRSHIDSGLNNYPIPKLTLQPLVENCIRHGFQDNMSCQIVANPCITIIAYRKSKCVLIRIDDNGSGIDIDQANCALTRKKGSEENGHVGLNNVFRRLKTYYGDNVEITFESTPFYKNSVILNIPYSSEAFNDYLKL